MDFLYLRFEYVITFPSACCNISVVFGSLNKYAALRVTTGQQSKREYILFRLHCRTSYSTLRQKKTCQKSLYYSLDNCVDVILLLLADMLLI